MTYTDIFCIPTAVTVHTLLVWVTYDEILHFIIQYVRHSVLHGALSCWTQHSFRWIAPGFMLSFIVPVWWVCVHSSLRLLFLADSRGNWCCLLLLYPSPNYDMMYCTYWDAFQLIVGMQKSGYLNYFSFPVSLNQSGHSSLSISTNRTSTLWMFIVCFSHHSLFLTYSNQSVWHQKPFMCMNWSSRSVSPWLEQWITQWMSTYAGVPNKVTSGYIEK